MISDRPDVARCRGSARDAEEFTETRVAEMWASQMWSIWAKSELIAMDAIKVFAGGLITYAAKRATPAAGLVLRALASGEDERDRLLGDFLDSDETLGLSGTDGGETWELEQLAHQVMTFSLDYNLGTPLRFSPVMVEIFCLDWAPRKITADADAFTVLPDVLAAWIRFVGRRRGIPEQSVARAVAAAYEYAPEMIELSRDPENWGPAKRLGLAIQQRGVDITDQAALNNLVAEINRDGGIDLLAYSLAGSAARRH